MYMASVANKFYSLVLEHRGVNSKTQRFKASHSPSFIFFLVSLLFIVIILTLFCLKLETNEPFF